MLKEENLVKESDVVSQIDTKPTDDKEDAAQKVAPNITDVLSPIINTIVEDLGKISVDGTGLKNVELATVEPSEEVFPKPTFAKEPSSQKVETIVERKITEYVQDDGTKVKNETTVIKHVKYYREITSIDGKQIEIDERSEHLGTEVFEDILEISPGITDLSSPEVETVTREQHVHEILEDGTWLDKKVEVYKCKINCEN